MAFDRRKFLKGWAIGSAAVLGGGTVAAYAGRAKPTDIVVPDPSQPERIAEAKKVIVVGGGLAGLSAAIELAERGFAVEVYEAGSECGGRVGGWSTMVGGERMTLEHGFHGFFYQYYNLNNLIDRACDNANFLPNDAYPVAYKGLGVDVLYANDAPFPFNMLNVVIDSERLDMLPLSVANPSHIFDMLKFDPIKTYELLDNISFADWAKATNAQKDLYTYFYDPYVRTMFVRPEEVSTAEMLAMFHSYMVANPEGMGMRVLKKPSLESLIHPLVAYLEKLGGKVHTSSPVEALHIENGRVAGIVRNAASSGALFTLSANEIPAQGYRPLETADGLVYIGRDKANKLTALSAKCSHMGCPVNIDAETGGFICPCHSGRYDASGEVISGPPPKALTRIPVVSDGQRVTVGGAGLSTQDVVPADYVIMATDVPGLKHIANKTQWPEQSGAWLKQVERLTVCRPYSVARHWLDKPVKADRYPLYTVGGYHLLDEIFIFNQFQDESIEWAKRTGGSIVETHCYALDHDIAADPQRVAEEGYQQMLEILPELQGAKVLHREVQMLENFSGYGLGDQAHRPYATTPIDNLLLAGDYVRIDLPLELMERATTSGRIAANAILDKHGVRKVGITTPPPKGILA